MAFAYCPDCSSRIYLGERPHLGEPAWCDTCGADLEVVNVNPPALAWAEATADAAWETEWAIDFEEA
jgi:lysine biosynthesis protein LysW